MTDYDLGKASGKIEIDYSDTGVRKAIVDLDKATDSSEKLDRQLTSTERTLSDTDRQFQSSGTAAQGYRQRLQDVEKSSKDVNEAEKAYKSTLLDSKSTLNDVEKAHARVTAAKQKHTQATNAERNAYRALNLEMLKGHGVMAALAAALPALERRISGIGSAAETAERKTTGLARGISGIAKAVGLLGPEADLAVGGLELISRGFDKASSSSGGFIKGLAGFEATFAKISGLSLTIPSLGGLGAIGGASVLQGVVEVADAVRQLSGALGLIPAVAGGVGVVMGTLKVALHGVDSALKDMFADDPKKFLEDIKNMGPVAAQALLQVAQFRNQFLAGGAAVQDSFFSKITADIKPLIQTWLPALVSGGSKVAGVLGGVADQFSKLLEQPQTLSAFNTFIDNIAKGLQSMQPAMGPILDAFTKLSVVGSSFFGQIGGVISQVAQRFDQFISRTSASGQLQQWIQTGINAFEHLGNIILQAGEAFNSILSIADKAGDGGLLGWLDKMTAKLNEWTQSTEGQKTLTEFFSTLSQASAAFLPILPQLATGFASIASAFSKLGVAIAPAAVDLIGAFVRSFQQILGPQLVASAPALISFMQNLGAAVIRLTESVGPQLPQIFEALSNAFVAILPTLPRLVDIFVQLIEQVGPQLPKLFEDVTQDIQELVPLMPSIIGAIRIFVSGLSLIVEIGGGVIKTIAQLNDAVTKDLPKAISGIADQFTQFFDKLPDKAVEWGKNIIKGLISGLTNNTEGIVTALDPIAGLIVDYFKTKSPAKIGPLHDTSPNEMGERIVNNMAAGMVGARPALAAAASVTASTVTDGIGRGTGGAAAAGSAPGAPAAGGASSVGGGGLLPPWIASASNAPLNAYLKHQFPDNDGLKGLAARFGKVLKAVQDGTNLFFQNGLQPVLQGLGNQNIFPGLNQQRFQKLSPQAFGEQQLEELQRKALEGKQGPQWGQVLGGGAGTSLGPDAGVQVPLGLTASSGKDEIQKAIIAAGRGRGLNDAAIQSALAIAGDESGYQNLDHGDRDSLGIYQQRPSQGWGTPQQIQDPNYAINKFYDAFVEQLGKNPTDPLLAAVQTQNPGAGKGSAYYNAIVAQLGGAGQALTQFGPGIKGPTFQQIAPQIGAAPTAGGAPTASKFPAGTKIAENGSILLPPNFPAPATPLPNLPTGSTIGPDGTVTLPTPGGALPTAPALAPGATAGGGFNLSTIPVAVQKYANDCIDASARIILSHSGVNLDEDQIKQVIAPGGTIESQAAGLNKLNSAGKYLALQGSGGTPQALFNAIRASIDSGTGSILNVAPGSSIAGRNFGEGHFIAVTGYNADGTINLSDTAGGKTYAVSAADAFQATRGRGIVAGTGVGPPPTPGPAAPLITPTGIPAATGLGGDLTLPGGQTVNQLLDTSKQSLTANQQLLNAYLAGNPALAAQIGAAKTPGASDDQVLSTLNQISSTITGLKSQDAVGNKNTIDALQSTQSDIAQGSGYAQAPSAVSVASSIANGVSSIATSIFSTIQSGLDALSATQDITDRLVYGISNTKDVSHIIDDFQKYITFAASIAQTTGSILSTIGGVAGAAGSGDPSGASSGAALALSAAGQVASLIGAALQGVNAAIDYGQEIAQIASGYVGRFLSTLTGPTQMLGDVRFLLNENTSQLLTYSEDNPLNKNSQNVPGGISARQGWGGGNPNPQVSQQLNVYAGPGQSPAEMMNQTMWMVNTSGTMGALAGANF